MTEQPKWMPTPEEIKLAFWESYKSPQPWGECVERIGALISRAVEKALAEQMEKLVSDDGIKFDGWPEGTDMAREIEWATGLILADERLHRTVNFMIAGRAQARVNAALAERDKGYNCPICGGIEPDSGRPCACAGTNDVRVAFDCLHSDWGRLVAERSEQEARHKREVIEAKIMELESGILHDPGKSVARCPICIRIAHLRSELAALTTSEPQTEGGKG